MERIEVHMRVNVTKVFEVDVPIGENAKDYARKVIKTDPTCRHQRIRKVYYDAETEKPISAKHFVIKQQRKFYLIPNRILNEQCLKLEMYILGRVKPLEALSGLISQSQKDGNVHADYIVDLQEPFRKKFSVDQLLDKIQV